MKNRMVLFILAFVTIALFSTEELLAQKKSPFTLNAWRNWMQVDSYNGVIAPRALSLQVQTTNAINQTDWYINVRILDSEIDQSKIRLILNSIDVVGGGDPLRDANYGAIYPLGSGDTRIITSNQSLNNNVTYTFIFDVEILGGDHLLELTLGKTYDVGFMFSAYTLKNENVDTFVEKNLQPKLPVRINDALTDIPLTPVFGIEVKANATLDFNTPEQYTRQVENDPNNSWINVISKESSYVITVKTNNPNFELIRNDSGVSGDATIPVNVVNVEVQSTGSGTSQGAKTLSSTTAQTLFIGTKNNNPQKIPVRYFITKTEAEKLATKTSGEYRAILTYTLEPN